MLDLPEPVLPTMPTFSAPRVWKDTPARGICPLVLQHKIGNVYESQCSGSGSTSQGYGSGSSYQQTKIVRKTLIPTVLWLLLDFLSLKNDVYIPQKVISRKTFLFIYFFVGVLMVNDENSRIRNRIRIRFGSISQRHGSADPDPDPHQYVKDPEHWWK